MHLLTVTIHWVHSNWPQILALVGGAGGLSVLLETLLNKAHIDSKKVAFTLLHLFGALTAVAAYFLANLPTTDVPAIFSGVVIAAGFWHRFAVSPAYNRFIVPYLEYLQTKKSTTVQLTPAVVAEPSDQLL